MTGLSQHISPTDAPKQPETAHEWFDLARRTICGRYYKYYACSSIYQGKQQKIVAALLEADKLAKANGEKDIEWDAASLLVKIMFHAIALDGDGGRFNTTIQEYVRDDNTDKLGEVCKVGGLSESSKLARLVQSLLETDIESLLQCRTDMTPGDKRRFIRGRSSRKIELHSSAVYVKTGVSMTHEARRALDKKYLPQYILDIRERARVRSRMSFNGASQPNTDLESPSAKHTKLSHGSDEPSPESGVALSST